MVAPAAAIPLGLLLLIFGPLYFYRQPQLPRVVIPLFAFILLAVLSTALAFFIEFPLFRDVDRLRNGLSGFLTLTIGVSFFLAALILTNSPERLAFFFQWVNISGGLVLLWAGLQSAFWYIGGDYPDWMREIQRLISSSGSLYIRRTTGFAFEPSWLGHQLVVFYLPYWLAASFRRSSVFRWRLWKFTAENLLFGGGGVDSGAFTGPQCPALFQFIGRLVNPADHSPLCRVVAPQVACPAQSTASQAGFSFAQKQYLAGYFQPLRWYFTGRHLHPHPSRSAHGRLIPRAQQPLHAIGSRKFTCFLVSGWLSG